MSDLFLPRSPPQPPSLPQFEAFLFLAHGCANGLLLVGSGDGRGAARSQPTWEKPWFLVSLVGEKKAGRSDLAQPARGQSEGECGAEGGDRAAVGPLGTSLCHPSCLLSSDTNRSGHTQMQNWGMIMVIPHDCNQGIHVRIKELSFSQCSF